MSALNYRHLHYFWTVAKAGSIARASERLHVTPQTISGQLSLFEDALGKKLFLRARGGQARRRFELSDAGRAALAYAEEIFALGRELEEALRGPLAARARPFRVGVSDAVAKSVAYRLLAPATTLAEPVRIVCREGKLAGLLAELAVQRIDIVIADSAMPASFNVKSFSHLLGASGMSFFAAPALANALQRPDSRRGVPRLPAAGRAHPYFPQCLDGAPLLLPGEDSAVRARLLRWLDSAHIHPRIAGEFDDGALMNAFGEAGAGVFAAPTVIEEDVRRQLGVAVLGRTERVREEFYAISEERRLTHPAVVAISSAARQDLFGGPGRPRRGKSRTARSAGGRPAAGRHTGA